MKEMIEKDTGSNFCENLMLVPVFIDNIYRIYSI